MQECFGSFRIFKDPRRSSRILGCFPALVLFGNTRRARRLPRDSSGCSATLLELDQDRSGSFGSFVDVNLLWLFKFPLPSRHELKGACSIFLFSPEDLVGSGGDPAGSRIGSSSEIPRIPLQDSTVKRNV